MHTYAHPPKTNEVFYESDGSNSKYYSLLFL